MRRVKQAVIALGTQLISDERLREHFLFATDVLKSKRASTGLYFELLHEFGHMSNGIEVGATPIYIKVEKHLFVFKGDTIEYKKSDGFSSSALMYFDHDEDLSRRWVHAVRGGPEFTTHAKHIKTLSIRSRLFNKANALGSKTDNRSYDYQLERSLKDDSEALKFNEKAKHIAEEFLKTGLV